MNKFMEYLHQKYPNKYPPTYFDPITNSQFRSLEMIRKQRGLVRNRKYIKDEHWEIIKRNIENDPHLKIIEICYEFGLRRSEALALSSVENLFKDNLFVKEQVKCIDYTNGVMTRIFKPTKTGETRRIPYKASISEISIKRIATIIDTFEFISPNQLTKKWRALMNELNLDYDIHDCKHSFCRNLFKVKNHDIKTTMEYSGHKEILSDILSSEIFLIKRISKRFGNNFIAIYTKGYKKRKYKGEVSVTPLSSMIGYDFEGDIDNRPFFHSFKNNTLFI
ncbi:MAG: hypothetical protein QF441_07895 [Bacteriovoracaceae bacterium]|nr:hypothetical protein [Bacteriovoracaceae bacterium]